MPRFPARRGGFTPPFAGWRDKPAATFADARRVPALALMLASVLLMTAALALGGHSALAAQSRPASANGLVTVLGTLTNVPGKGPALESAGKEYVLQGQSAYLLHTLQDKRLLNQELQLTGAIAPGGALVVRKLYAVRNGKLYHVQYYCEVCNITYVQPGHCYCCGRETKLQEVPVH
ncbi:MAG: hypothetical protein ACRD1N_04295 [Terriglobia bacterium]